MYTWTGISSGRVDKHHDKFPVNSWLQDYPMPAIVIIVIITAERPVDRGGVEQAKEAYSGRAYQPEEVVSCGLPKTQESRGSKRELLSKSGPANPHLVSRLASGLRDGNQATHYPYGPYLVD